MNHLNLDLTGSYVILKPECFKKRLNTDHPFLCKSGNGCDLVHNSTEIWGMLSGAFGEQIRVSSHWVLRKATEVEILNARDRFNLIDPY